MREVLPVPHRNPEAVERLEGKGPATVDTWVDEVIDLNEVMKKTSACGLGQAAPLLTESLIRYFPDRIRKHVAQGGGGPAPATKGRRR